MLKRLQSGEERSRDAVNYFTAKLNPLNQHQRSLISFSLLYQTSKVHSLRRCDSLASRLVESSDLLAVKLLDRSQPSGQNGGSFPAVFTTSQDFNIYFPLADSSSQVCSTTKSIKIRLTTETDWLFSCKALLLQCRVNEKDLNIFLSSHPSQTRFLSHFASLSTP